MTAALVDSAIVAPDFSSTADAMARLRNYASPRKSCVSARTADRPNRLRKTVRNGQSKKRPNEEPCGAAYRTWNANDTEAENDSRCQKKHFRAYLPRRGILAPSSTSTQLDEDHGSVDVSHAVPRRSCLVNS